MAVVRDVVDALERLAPRRHALSGDKVGLQVGDPEAFVAKVAVSLDRTPSAVEFAVQEGAQMLVSHHPLIFSPLDSVTSTTLEGRTVIDLCRKGIAFAAAHTNWDAAKGGINDTLAKHLGLHDVRPFGEAAKVEHLKLVFFCPEDHVERVLDAVSEAGAGVIGGYTRCAYLSNGVGTFIAGAGTNPTIGTPGSREEVPEVKVETILPAGKEGEICAALLSSHPYEEPAYDLAVLTPAEEMPLGRVGRLDARTTLEAFVHFVDHRLRTRSLAWGDPKRTIETVAVVGGSADGEWRHAKKVGADVLVTGEVRQHFAVEAVESGFALLSSGHYATEHPGSAALAEALGGLVPEVEFVVFEPAPGFAGRPF